MLVATGSSLLYQVGYGIYNFNDVPKAHDELLRVRAKAAECRH